MYFARRNPLTWRNILLDKAFVVFALERHICILFSFFDYLIFLTLRVCVFTVQYAYIFLYIPFSECMCIYRHWIILQKIVPLLYHHFTLTVSVEKSKDLTVIFEVSQSIFFFFVSLYFFWKKKNDNNSR